MASEASRTSGPPVQLDGGEERALLERFVDAFTAGDVDALLALMTEDVWVRMPPLPFEYHGTDAVRRFFTATKAHLRGNVHLVPVGANRQPAWGEYVRDPASGRLHLTGVLVLGRTAHGIDEVTHFGNVVAPSFGLPRVLDALP